MSAPAGASVQGCGIAGCVREAAHYVESVANHMVFVIAVCAEHVRGFDLQPVNGITHEPVGKGSS